MGSNNLQPSQTTSSGSKWARAWGDLCEALGQSWFWLNMGWADVVQRYRGSMLGPFWLTIATAVFVVGLGPLYAALFNLDTRQYLPFLAIGIICWHFISGTLNEMCRAFIDAGPQMKQIVMPRLNFVFHILWRNFVIFAHNLPIVAIVLWYGGVEINLSTLMVVPGLLLLCVNMFTAGVILAVISARFRDIIPIVSSILMLAFFLTPILWHPATQRAPFWVIELNPFAAFVELVRGPLLNQTYSLALALNTAVTTAVLAVIAAWLFARYRKYIVYWV